MLKIGDLLLHLGANASFVSLGSNPFSTSKMIRTNVVTSDRGLRKTFNSVVSNFTFPVGVVRGLDDVFTPVSITFNSLSAPKSITIIPVNGVHPTVVSPFRALDFYWKVFDSNPGTTGSGSVEFNYVQALVDNPANEVNYIPARLQGVNWAKFPSADVDEASNTISFTFDNTSLGTDNTLSNNAGSHYTAGLDADIPNQIPVFQYNPNANGAWNDINNWRRSDDGGANYNAYGAGIPVNGPSGQLVHIPAGAVVNAQGSDTPANMLAQRNPYSTQIDGELIIGNTRANSLGIVSGAGKITLGGSDRAVYPAGDYAAFLANPNSTVEYTGSLSYTIDNRTSSIGKLIISGGGTKTLPSGTQNVNNNLTVASGTVLNNTLNNADIVVGNNFNLNGTLNTGGGNNISVDGNLNLNAGSTFNQSSNLNVIVKGNITKNASASVNSNNSSLTLNGNAVQTISGQLTFNNLTVNNAAGITVSGADAFTVESNLTFSNGLINTTGSINTSNFRVKNGNVTITGASQSSYINGPMQLISLGTGSPYPFPVGNLGRFGQALINPTCANQTWTVNYRNNNPTAALGENLDPAFTSQFPLGTVSNNEYWTIDGPTPCNAAISLRWDSTSNVASDPVERAKLKIMRWDNGNSYWEMVSNLPAINDGAQTITSTVAFSTQNLTIGSENDSINPPPIPLPVDFLYFKGKTEHNYHVLDWATATETINKKFEIERSSDGNYFEKIGEMAGEGNSRFVKNYQFIDEAPLKGINYYRLKQIDFDGNYEYSNSISLLYSQFGTEEITAIFYPNPIQNQQLNIRLSNAPEDIQPTLLITDMLGRTYWNQQLPHTLSGITVYTIDVVSKLPKGIYAINVFSGEFQFQEKLIVR